MGKLESEKCQLGGRRTDRQEHTEKPTDLMRPVAAIEIGYAGHGASGT